MLRTWKISYISVQLQQLSLEKRYVEERNIVLNGAISGSKLGTFPLKNAAVKPLEKCETPACSVIALSYEYFQVSNEVSINCYES